MSRITKELNNRLNIDLERSYFNNNSLFAIFLF